MADLIVMKFSGWIARHIQGADFFGSILEQWTSSSINTISRQFNQELEMLRQDVMAMGGVAEEMVRDAMARGRRRRHRKAQRVIDMDDQVNEIWKRRLTSRAP